MKAVFDPKKDILQISFSDSTVEETSQVSPGLILDYDEDGHIIGIELRQASQRIKNPYQMSYEVGEADTDKPDI